jgi:hypothetical protein
MTRHVIGIFHAYASLALCLAAVLLTTNTSSAGLITNFYGEASGPTFTIGGEFVTGGAWNGT